MNVNVNVNVNVIVNVNVNVLMLMFAHVRTGNIAATNTPRIAAANLVVFTRNFGPLAGVILVSLPFYSESVQQTLAA